MKRILNSQLITIIVFFVFAILIYVDRSKIVYSLFVIYASLLVWILQHQQIKLNNKNDELLTEQLKDHKNGLVLDLFIRFFDKFDDKEIVLSITKFGKKPIFVSKCEFNYVFDLNGHKHKGRSIKTFKKPIRFVNEGEIHEVIINEKQIANCVEARVIDTLGKVYLIDDKDIENAKHCRIKFKPL